MCHTPAPQQPCGVRLLREPKGVPDVILITRSPDTKPLFAAASILAVQGYTARLILLEDEALFAAQAEGLRESLLPSGRKDTTLFERATPQETAQEARRCILAAQRKRP